MATRKQLDTILQSLKKGQKLDESSIKKVCDQAKQIMKTQPNVINVHSPVTICGDIHGQFDDLLELFKIGGFPPYTNYIFMGDYVDRGKNNVETFLLLLTLKVRYKNRVTLLRGNHECRLITQAYGFYDECIKKYASLNVWKACTQVFDYLPLGAVVDDKVYCVHGGLSPNIKYVKDMSSIDRIKQIPHEGPMCDTLWSDPEQIQGWTKSPRGAGYLFGRDTVETFCHNNGFSLISRAHQLVKQGYKFMFNQKIVTVWSAPNYAYRLENVASIMELDENLHKYFKIFEAAPTDVKHNGGGEVPQYFL